MAENSKIEWTTHTFNPWVGCTKVSPACDNCYAETWAKRTGQPALWQGERRRTTAANWRQPLKWNREAEQAGRRDRVFCASLADVFDNQVPGSWRCDLWDLIYETPHLDWLLLTKRPQNIAKMLPTEAISAPAWGNGWPNVWLGTTVENQAEADRRIPHLLVAPAAKRFLSCEPLLGPLRLHHIPDRLGESSCHVNALTGARWYPGCGSVSSQTHPGPHLDWVITGGESGPRARPSHPDWFRSLRDQCVAAGVPFHFKQWGEWTEATDEEIPERFGPECDAFRSMCSNGFVGPLAMESAFLHKPRVWPQCFPNGEDGDACCRAATVRRIGKKAAGRLLDGREHNEAPHG